MSPLPFLFAFAAGLGLASPPLVTTPDDDVDAEAVRAAALDYVDGFYESDGARIERGVHPSLQKVTVEKTPWGTDLLKGMDRASLVEFAGLGGVTLPVAERKLRVTSFARSGNIATVEIDSARFRDYAHVAKINDQWRVINVLWAMHTPVSADEPTPEDLAAIEQAGLDYVGGYYAGSAERIGRALHPRLQKVVVRKLPNGREFFHYATADGLVDYTRTGQGKKAPEECNVTVTIHTVYGGIATVTVESSEYLDYAHVAKLDGKWKIVNVLWQPNG